MLTCSFCSFIEIICIQAAAELPAVMLLQRCKKKKRKKKLRWTSEAAWTCSEEMRAEAATIKKFSNKLHRYFVHLGKILFVVRS